MKERVGKIKLDFWFFVKFFVIASMCLFIVYPFYTILTKSVFSNKVEGLTLYNFVRFFTKPYYYQTLLRSLMVCGVTVHCLCDDPLQCAGQTAAAYSDHYVPDEPAFHRRLFLDHPHGS